MEKKRCCFLTQLKLLVFFLCIWWFEIKWNQGRKKTIKMKRWEKIVHWKYEDHWFRVINKLAIDLNVVVQRTMGDPDELLVRHNQGGLTPIFHSGFRSLYLSLPNFLNTLCTLTQFPLKYALLLLLPFTTLFRIPQRTFSVAICRRVSNGGRTSDAYCCHGDPQFGHFRHAFPLHVTQWQEKSCVLHLSATVKPDWSYVFRNFFKSKSTKLVRMWWRKTLETGFFLFHWYSSMARTRRGGQRASCLGQSSTVTCVTQCQ